MIVYRVCYHEPDGVAEEYFRNLSDARTFFRSGDTGEFPAWMEKIHLGDKLKSTKNFYVALLNKWEFATKIERIEMRKG
jgi:hypothetical protein